MSSPRDLIESQFPNYFLEQYPQFVKFIEEYYDFLESSIVIFNDAKNCKVGDILYGTLSKSKAIVKIAADGKFYFDYATETNTFFKNEIVLNGSSGEIYIIKNVYQNIFSFAKNMENDTAYDTVRNLYKKYFKRNISLDHSIFRRLDPNTLSKRIIDYYQKRGTEDSMYWFFRIFFDDDIELYYPKVDILKLSDTNHIQRRWMRIDVNASIERFYSTRIVGTKSKATATVRATEVKERHNHVRAFLDLIFINGIFEEGEEIIGYDIITGQEKATNFVRKTVGKLKVVDGGVGHHMKDVFAFADGIGEVVGQEEYSVTQINVLNPGYLHSPGDVIEFDNEYRDATAFANAEVQTVQTDYQFSDYAFHLNTVMKFQQVSSFLHLNLTDFIANNSPTIFGHANSLSHLPGVWQELGAIDKLQINKSGLDYKFAPSAKVINTNKIAHITQYYDLTFDLQHPNTYSLDANTFVLIDGEPAYFQGIKSISNGIFLSNTNMLTEDFHVHRFIAPRWLQANNQIASANVEFYPTGNTLTLSDILFDTYNKNELLTLPVKALNSWEGLANVSHIEPELGYGVARVQSTQAGLLADLDDQVKFLDKPELRDYDNPNIIHGLSAGIELEETILFDPIPFFHENNSNLSSEKHIQDNYYYQTYSYEIITSLKPEDIDMNLFDDLHPAGFIAFVRNRMDWELQQHMKVTAFPKIEIYTETAKCMIDTHEAIQRIQITHKKMELESNEERDFYTRVEVDAKVDGTIKETEVFPRFEETAFVDAFEAFKFYVEDVLIRPASSTFTEFRKCEGSSLSFDNGNTSASQSDYEITFDSIETSPPYGRFDGTGGCKLVGYGTTKEYQKLIQEQFHYDGHVAVESFVKLINVEDQANWKTDIIEAYGGKIADRRDKQINNHVATVEEIIDRTVGNNPGKRILIRDSMGEGSNVFMDTEHSRNSHENRFYDAYPVNFTENPFWLWDLDKSAFNAAALGIDPAEPDFSDDGGGPNRCTADWHDHNARNFSNAPANAYTPTISGNTIEYRGSYLPTTEVLTRNRGFVQIQYIRQSDIVATINDRGETVWLHPTDIIRQEYTGYMYRITDYNRISFHVTPRQNLVLFDDREQPKIKAELWKAERINLPRFVNHSFGIVDPLSVTGTGNSITDYVPVTNCHKFLVEYTGYVYCLQFADYKEGIAVSDKMRVGESELNALQIALEIRDREMLPKIDIPAESPTLWNYDHLESGIKININQFQYNIESNSAILGISNTWFEETRINSAKILNLDGPVFDRNQGFWDTITFDKSKAAEFSDTASRFKVFGTRTFAQQAIAITNKPVVTETPLIYDTKVNIDYHGTIGGFLPDSPYFEKANTANGEIQEKQNTELIQYTMLDLGDQSASMKPVSTLTTEQDIGLYPKFLSLKMSWDNQPIDPPTAVYGSMDAANTTVLQYRNQRFSEDGNTLLWDSSLGARNYTELPDELLRYHNLFDSIESAFSFDKKNARYLKNEQNIIANQTLSSEAEGKAPAKYGGSEFVRIRENFGTAIVATIKNYRIDPKKKFFDSLIYTFDLDYNKAQYSAEGWDSGHKPEKFDLDCIHLFFDADGINFGREDIQYYTRDFAPKTLDNSALNFTQEDTKFDRYGWLYKDCSTRYTPFPYDEDVNVTLNLKMIYEIDGYGPHNYAAAFDDGDNRYGWSRTKFPKFDNSRGAIKPYVDPEYVIAIESGESPFDVGAGDCVLEIDASPFRDVEAKLVLEQPLEYIKGPFFDYQGKKTTFDDNIDYKFDDIHSGHVVPLIASSEQTLVNYNDVYVCDYGWIYHHTFIDRYLKMKIHPFLSRTGGCPPDTTEGTVAVGDYYFYNVEHRDMSIELEDVETIVYHAPTEVTETIETIQTQEIEVVTDILSCKPIRYTDTIAYFERYFIQAYITDDCPGPERLQRNELFLWPSIINDVSKNMQADVWQAIFSDPEDSNLSEVTVITDGIGDVRLDSYYGEHYVYINNEIRSRNCAIAQEDLIKTFMYTKITDCFLRGTIRDYTRDMMYSTKVSQETIQIQTQQPNTWIVEADTFPTYTFSQLIDNQFQIKEILTENEISIPINDRWKYLSLDDIISEKMFDSIGRDIQKNEIVQSNLQYIPTVRVKGLTKIRKTDEVLTNSTAHIVSSLIRHADQDVEMMSEFNEENESEIIIDLKDRGKIIDLNDIIASKFWKYIQPNMGNYELTDNPWKYIPTVQAFAFNEIETYRHNLMIIKANADTELGQNVKKANTANANTTTTLTHTMPPMREAPRVDSRDDFHRMIDAEFRLDDNPELEYVMNLRDRWMLLNLDDIISSKYYNLLPARPQIYTISDYVDEYIPTVRLTPFNEIEQYRNNVMTATYETMTTIPFTSDLDVSHDTDEENEIEIVIDILDRNIVIDKNKVIAAKYYDYIYENMMKYPILDYVLDRIPVVTVDSRPSVGVSGHHKHDLQANTFSDTILTGENLHQEIDISHDADADNEVEYIINMFDRWSTIPLDEKPTEGRWEKWIITKKSLIFPIVENGKAHMPTMRVDPMPSIVPAREEKHDLPSNTFYYTVFTGENFHQEIDISHDADPQNEIEFVTTLWGDYTINLSDSIGPWYDEIITDALLRTSIRDQYSTIHTPKFKTLPEIEVVYEHNANVEYFTASTLYDEATFNDVTGKVELEGEHERNIHIPDRHRLVNMNDRIPHYLADEYIHDSVWFDLGKEITWDDGYAIPRMTIDSRPSIESLRTYHHDIQSNTFLFETTTHDSYIDQTFETTPINDIEFENKIVQRATYFDLTKPIPIEQWFGMGFIQPLTEDVYKLRLTDWIGDKAIFGAVDPEVYIVNANTVNMKPEYEFVYTALQEQDIFLNMSLTFERQELDLHTFMYNDRSTLGMQRQTKDWFEDWVLADYLHYRLDPNMTIPEVSGGPAEQRLINRPIHSAYGNKQWIQDRWTFKLTTDLQEADIETTFSFNQMVENQMIFKETSIRAETQIKAEMLPDSLDENGDIISRIQLDEQRSIMFYPVGIEKYGKNNNKLTWKMSANDWVSEYMTKPIEEFVHVPVDVFDMTDIRTESEIYSQMPNANTVSGNTCFTKLDEQKLSMEYVAEGSPFANSITFHNSYGSQRLGVYYPKDACLPLASRSEIYNQYVKSSNVKLQGVEALLPLIDDDAVNAYSQDPNYTFPYDSTNVHNKDLFFDKSGPAYILDKNRNFFTELNDQTIDPVNNGPLANRTIEMASFERYEFRITDIANTHTNGAFALGLADIYEDNRMDSANLIFGDANSTYMVDGVKYTNWADYEADFANGSNAVITFHPTIEFLHTKGLNANTANGDTWEKRTGVYNTPGCNITTGNTVANTFEIFYFTTANNETFSAGGIIRIYELNMLEAYDFTINKKEYLDNIRTLPEVNDYISSDCIA